MNERPNEIVAHVEVVPLGHVIEVYESEDVLHAAQRANYWWPTLCQGNAQCGVCRLKVLWSDLPQHEPGVKESRALQRFGYSEPSRLACQLRPAGRLRVFKAGVRPREK